mgnify:CR=1 FL=1
MGSSKPSFELLPSVQIRSPSQWKADIHSRGLKEGPPYPLSVPIPYGVK